MKNSIRWTVTLPHPEAAAGVMSGKSPVNSHYAVSPFYYYELATPGVHLVLKLYDTLGGPHVNGVLLASPSFVRDNPGIAAAAGCGFFGYRFGGREFHAGRLDTACRFRKAACRRCCR